MSGRDSYPGWWPAALWVGLAAAAGLSTLPSSVILAPVRSLTASNPRLATSAPHKARKASEAVPGAALARCKRNSFGRCES